MPSTGMYDGNVAVYNLQTNPTDPIYMSKGQHGKHSDVVWEVKWGPDMTDGEINFFSISSDGRVFNWVLMQSKLTITTIITLFLEREFVGGPEGTDIKLKGHPQYIPLRLGKWQNFLCRLWNMHDVPSKATRHFPYWNGRGSDIQMQHGIQFEIFDDLLRPLSSSVSH